MISAVRLRSALGERKKVIVQASMAKLDKPAYNKKILNDAFEKLKGGR
jgi:hypothetical protein